MILTKQDLIEINKGILQEWIEKNPADYEGVAANDKALEDILKAVDEQDSVILKAANLMARIAWLQPFAGGNKRTGIISADTLLRMSGYRLVVEDENDIEYLRKLLFEVQEERSTLNPETLAKIVLYVTKRIRKL
ncbi:MAG: Fic family protein [Nitrosopumilales archaeon]|nr:Fic family protein [Nitrosopumilales archaeon]